ncbi:hypothetical protein Pyn_37838 [Prunus yedoensis var. nudiflora]|uniref:Aminotransferase-like plant mobile domain-containing protein n=1 Tax=Prunus yedoensis var. nudiflora TaxID=2094558 RepID=A0A314V0T6_PRUYE|nr:hypothetical protein Pyn_37838 [Prunus yedoensis var. nudiflora]
MAALFGLCLLGVKVNAALVVPEAEGSFKAAWPTVARLAGSKVKNMLNYSSFYINCSIEDSAEDGSIAPLGEVEHSAFLLYWLCKAPRKHNTTAFCFKFFYDLAKRTWSQFRVCLNRPFPLFVAHDLFVVPDGETENDLKEIWGSFLVTRDLHCILSKAGAEVYLPNFVARQFGLIQTALLPPLSTNRLSSWRADISPNHGVAGIAF